MKKYIFLIALFLFSCANKNENVVNPLPGEDVIIFHGPVKNEISSVTGYPYVDINYRNEAFKINYIKHSFESSSLQAELYNEATEKHCIYEKTISSNEQKRLKDIVSQTLVCSTLSMEKPICLSIISPLQTYFLEEKDSIVATVSPFQILGPCHLGYAFACDVTHSKKFDMFYKEIVDDDTDCVVTN